MATPTELIAGILRDFPRHQPGTRPVHAYGVLAEGWFRPTDVATRYTTAVALNEPRGVKAIVRFSNGSGNCDASDARPDVRGMAVRLHGDTDDALDLVSMTVPTFFVRTVDGFQGFTAAAEPPNPPVSRPRWRDLLDALNLRTPGKDPGPGDAGVVAFSAAHRESCPALVANFNAATPESFATLAYHAVHAFHLTNAAGVTHAVRFHWEPVAGVRSSRTTAEHYLRGELAHRVLAAPIRFVLRAQVADQGDDTSDPSRPWPTRRRRLVLGHLSLDRVDAEGGEDLEFNPQRLPVGIIGDPTDEIFRARGEVYRQSACMRAQARQGG